MSIFCFLFIIGVSASGWPRGINTTNIPPGWQQEVRYTIEVSLDTKNHTLVGNEFIAYRNHSPDSLNVIWLHLYPNAYRERNTVFGLESERMQSYGFSFASKKERGYIEIKDLKVAGRAVHYEIQETEMKIPLPAPLVPGDSIELEIRFLLKIPAFFSRLGHSGKHYELVQWYPKIVVYDHRGWHPDGYHAIGEFYGEYGTFDVAITVPANMMVGATGILVKPRSELDWMRKPIQERKKLKADSLKTLSFHAENVHDFAWVADPDYVLLADSLNGVAINVLARRKSEKDWRKVTGYAKDALNYYRQWYGPYPYASLTVAQGSSTGGGMEYPNLVIISSSSPSWIRGLETVVIHEIGHQWFYGILGSNELAEAWLDEGITTFSEMRYLEAKYGKDNYFNWPRYLQYLPNIGDRYYQKLVYFIAATNALEKPILTPAHEFNDNPIAYASVEYSKAGFVIDMLRAQVGESIFGQIMQRYYQEYQFRHPTTDDFVRTAETVAGENLDWFFDQWLTTTQTCDYRIKDVHREERETKVAIERIGGIVMPVEVMAVTRNGGTVIQTWNGKNRHGTITFTTRSPVKQVVIDPNQRLLEIDRWNNYHPKKVDIKPIFDFPSFDAYQIFYCPYIWYNGGDGLEIGAWLQGRRFIDYDFLKGEHQWNASIVYGFRSQTWRPSFRYLTPLPFFDRRVRLGLGGSLSRIEATGEFGFNGKFGPVLKLPAYEVGVKYEYRHLKDLAARDTLDWELARTGAVKLNLSHSYLLRRWRGQERFDLNWCTTMLGGDTDYLKISAELNQTFRLTKKLRINLRFFGGNIWSKAPAQHQFFLSGSLLPTPSEPLTLAFLGTWATQEHWHITGDGNLRGYAGEHRRGTSIAAINLNLAGLPVPVKPFFDLGTVGNGRINFENLMADGGVSVNLGPLYADFPFWKNAPPAGESHFQFRWLVGVNVALGVSLL